MIDIKDSTKNGDLYPGSLDQNLSEEINRLENLRQIITHETICRESFAVLIGVILVNILLIWHYRSTYLFLWVAASLYFYLFYPMLPLALFPVRMVHQKLSGQPLIKKKDTSFLQWAKELRIFSNKRVGYQLFLRFFLLSMIPITYGVFCIYGLSVIFTIIIAYTSNFSTDTLILLLIQCLGIIIFYAEIFIFRGRMLHRTHLRLKNRMSSHRRIIVFTILGSVLITITTILVILMIVAMVMPAFTLTKYVNMIAFSYSGRDFSVLILLFSQFVIMQYLQSYLSRKVALTMISEFIDKLTKFKGIDSGERREEEEIKAGSLLLESRLYAYNRRQMLGLYPSYSIGVNIPVLLSIKDLKSLQEIFFDSS